VDWRLCPSSRLLLYSCYAYLCGPNSLLNFVSRGRATILSCFSGVVIGMLNIIWKSYDITVDTKLKLFTTLLLCYFATFMRRFSPLNYEVKLSFIESYQTLHDGLFGQRMAYPSVLFPGERLSRYYWTVDNANLLRFTRRSYHLD